VGLSAGLSVGLPFGAGFHGSFNMLKQKVQLLKKQAEGYIIPLGKLNLVFVITDIGFIGCGAFDIMMLDKYNYPAVKAKSHDGGPIDGIEKLLAGVVREVNESGSKLGIKTGMPINQAIELL